MDFYGILFDMKNGKKVPYSKTYFDTLFAAKLAEMQIKTLTGTLPLNFRTSETALRSWTIYGNNYEHKYSTSGTLPLTFTSHTAGNADDWSISGNDSVGKNFVDIKGYDRTWYSVRWYEDNGQLKASGTYDDSVAHSWPRLYAKLSAGTYTVSGSPNYAQTGVRVQVGTCTDAQGSNFASLGYDEGSGYTFTLQTSSWVSVRVYTAASLYQQTVDLTLPLMLRPADTSETFEPYQVGVGQRTKNLFNATIEQGGLNSGSEYGSNTRIRTTFMPNMLDTGTYTVTASGVNNVVVNYFDDNKTYIGGVTTWRTLPLTFNISNKCYVRFAFKMGNSQDVTPSDISNIMLVEGSAAPANFVPYGYEIPLSINGTPQTFYIGSAPLTAGQSVSKTSTGVDIAAIAGSNTISTDLYNKPEMSIEGVDYVGVGEYVNGQWQIPLTVTHYTDNIFDKDAKNANKGYEDSTCIMWAGSIPYPYMTGNIPEDNNCFVSEKIPASPNTTYYLTDGIFKNTDNGIYSVFLWNRFRMSDYQAFPTEKTFTTGDDTKFIQLCVLKSYADTVMITTKPTETYIPHVEVNNVNVPLDAPLTEDQSVTDTQTINTFEGENVLDTTLTDPVSMTIKYKE